MTHDKSTSKITQIRKREGHIVQFDKEKITNAIYRAIIATGGRDHALAESLSNRVVEILDEKCGSDVIPAVEDVQDVVERVLVENGQAKVAKNYIIYRQKRSELRREKQRILDKEAIDEVDKLFDLNALKVLKARYLKKDETGKLIETPKQLFTRIAIHSSLPDLLYDPEVYDLTKKQNIHDLESFDPLHYHEKVSIGKYRLNCYHLEAMKRMYDRFNREGAMRVTWSTFFERLRTGGCNDFQKSIDAFYALMVTRKFMPNTPAIANFGNALGMGSACFVLDIDDSIESIMETLKQTAVVFKAGGGMGYNFSKLRPEGDYVSSTSGIASGPISFMMLFDTMTDVIKQGGIRRGANMGIVNSNHPDIEKFITSKKGNKALRNFNISVLIMPDFWECYNKNKPYPLVNPRTKQIVREVNPRILFDMIVYQAWESAEPGVIFFDHVNEHNPFYKHLGPIVTTNPCGEVLLYPNESCNLGSLNVWAFVQRDENGKVTYDWERLKDAVIAATRFLDNVIDVNNFPLKSIEDMTLATRKIGLGVMGLADLLFELRMGFNSEEGRKFMEELMEFVNYHSKIASIELAKQRGPLPFYNKSFYPEGRLPFAGIKDRKSWHFEWDKVSEMIKQHGVRNGYTTVIAPTGSISMIAGCSSGMEPVYSLVFEKHVKVGSFYYIDPVFERVMTEEGLFGEDLLRDVNEHGGSIQKISYIPDDLKRVYITAMDIRPEDHIRALAAFQKWTDSSISKTNNFPANSTVDDMRESYLLAYKLGCKDVTVFRDTSIQDQVLVAPKKKENSYESEKTTSSATKSPQILAMPIIGASQRVTEEIKLCPQCQTQVVYQEGCYICPECAWGACS
ncbi:MAG TPA: adenosylcobalamin-dependent ribonucleoside-diphosphate reductase [Candidatus Bathyarchaeia archaeon]|nr:adenosylcobalamin-dependent ribonucleoside-diphosphate reductase [Candidatus Bathyarchaeia archaeon]